MTLLGEEMVGLMDIIIQTVLIIIMVLVAVEPHI